MSASLDAQKSAQQKSAYTPRACIYTKATLIFRENIIQPKAITKW